MGNGDTFSGIGYARACMMDIHVQVDICMEDGEWGYILWDRLGPSMHDGYPCKGRDMYGRWGYIPWDSLCPSMHDGYPCTGRDICTADEDTFSGIG